MNSPALRLAVGNIHRPGALTPSVVLSLGLGLALLVTLALIDGNLRRQLSGEIADKAPNFFFVDIQGSEREGFLKTVQQYSPQGVVTQVPMLRAVFSLSNGTDVTKMNVPQGGAGCCAATAALPMTKSAVQFPRRRRLLVACRL